MKTNCLIKIKYNYVKMVMSESSGSQSIDIHFEGSRTLGLLIDVHC